MIIGLSLSNHSVVCKHISVELKFSMIHRYQDLLAADMLSTVYISISFSSIIQNITEYFLRARHPERCWSLQNKMSQARILIPRTSESSAIYIGQSLLFQGQRKMKAC